MIGRHKFSSGIADSSDTALVLASDWNADVLLGYVLTNRTGGQLAAGDVVAISSANDNSVILADADGAVRQFVVFVSALPSSASHAPGSTIEDTQQGLFLSAGVATVKVDSATTRGNYLKKSATAKALADSGIGVGNPPPVGSIGTALQGSGGAGTIPAVFHGLPIRITEAFPVGSVFIAVVSTNPATLLGYGTWTAISAGRVLVGQDTGDVDFDVLEETGGAKSQTTGTPSLTGTIQAGTGVVVAADNHTHNVSVLQPYLVVKIWKRTA